MVGPTIEVVWVYATDVHKCISFHLLIVMFFSSTFNCVQQVMDRQELLMLFNVKNIAVVYMSIVVRGRFAIAHVSSFVNTSALSKAGHALT